MTSPATNANLDSSEPRPTTPADPVPLCVDLDGTLIKTDLLVELAFGLLRQRPSEMLKIPVWLAQGKSVLKTELAARVSLDIPTLPYNVDVVAFLKQQKAMGRPIYLVTASPAPVADKISAHLGLFDGVMGTTKDTNLAGGAKRDQLVQAFGKEGFDYMGNAWADLPIWGAARNSVVINPHLGVRSAAERAGRVTTVLDNRPPLWRALLKTIRAHQWMKNVLVFAPVVSAHQITELSTLGHAAMAFAALSLCASAIYIINDLLDLASDRAHPTKKRRPLAAGNFPVTTAMLLVPVAILGATAIAWSLPVNFQLSLVLYTLMSVLYSVWLKRHELLDVIVLAGLWTLRVVIGGTATQIDLSFWLLAFSMFLFTSFALAKRCSELYAVRSISRERALGRDYRVTDLAVLAALGGGSGCMAVLVMALYINSSEVRLLYRFPEAIWMLCPLLMYWVGRVWLKTWRGEMEEDPVLFAITDRASRWIAAAAVITLAVATWPTL